MLLHAQAHYQGIKAAESWFALPEEIQKQSDFDKYGSVAATLHEIKAEKIVYRKLAKLGDVGAIMAELEQYGETISGTNPYALRISPNYIMLLSDFGEDYIWERRNLRDFKRADNKDMHELKIFDGNEEITVSFHGDGAVIAFDAIIRACENA